MINNNNYSDKFTNLLKFIKLKIIIKITLRN